ncbi:MAG: NAD(P)/FAD-dependent oxidoreductase [Acidobacteria bacterium]|nr:NAD(P)/FAD-dependent oxidoreductase [Acidobacteriota bacterium]
MQTPSHQTVVMGAGPAGLTAAWELARLGRSAVVFESSPWVGGLSRTVSYKGYRFDIGGHRFFSKLPEIEALWSEMLGEDFLERPRMSRIHYNGKFFDYPLRPLNALRGLGVWESMRVTASYVASRISPYPEEENFAQWVSNRFGRRLFEIFFETYTEKVWGIPCSEISADWAAQRIKDLDFLKAVKNALLGQRRGGEVVTTLIDRFHYPRHGPGMMWERFRDRLEDAGIRTVMNSPVVRVRHDGNRVSSVGVRSSDGVERDETAESFISSMAISALVRCLDPAPPQRILDAADALRYRDFLTVVLIVGREQVFPDNWIYIHSPDVRVGRVQNFKQWSPEMVPDSGKTSLGLEYFVNEGDDLWSATDEELLALGEREMATLGLIEPGEVEDGTVVRVRKAYPVYDGSYREHVATLREYVCGFANLQLVGRNGQHRYNNQDHSMAAGILAARNVAGEDHDVWAVNVEQEYLESKTGDRLTPEAIGRPSVEEMLRSAFARYDPVALGVAFALVGASSLFLATAALLLQPGEPVGPTLSLLGNYLLGFEASWGGAVIGFVDAEPTQSGIGYLLAGAINLLVGWHESMIRKRIELSVALDPLTGADR